MALIEKKYVFMVAAGLVVGLAAVFAIKKAAGLATDVAGDALNAINPLNNDNVINKAATSVYQAITGSDGTIGTDLYGALNKSPFEIEAEKKKREQDAMDANTVREQTGWDTTPGLY